jgi:t-SNARE complex subunit (syntaxin)
MTDFSIDGKEIDVEALSDQGKAALQKAVNLNQQLLNIEEQRQDLTLLINHYASIVREETSEEDE